MLTDAEAADLAGVGRLNIAGNRHCTATLIARDLVLTAAHCLYNPQSGRRAPPEEIRFVAGLRRDDYAALRGVAALAVPPDYDFAAEPDLAEVRHDLAMLRLDAPVAASEALPVPEGAWPGGGSVAVVGYGRDRAQAASIRADCPVLGAEDGLAVLGCTVTLGVSGAPVLAGTGAGRRIVAIVSAMGESDLGPVALVVPLAGRLAPLRSALGAGEP